jgi:hypothetical protein
MIYEIILDFCKSKLRKERRREVPPLKMKLLFRNITLFGNDTEWTEICNSRNQGDNPQVEPFVTCSDTYTDKGKSYHNSDRTAYFSYFIDIHDIFPLKDF